MTENKDHKQPDKKRAIALSYNEEKDNAPILIARGDGPIADRILAVAKDHGIYIQEDSQLLSLLSTIDIDEEIPIEAFTAVAEILSYLYQLERRL